MVDPPFGGLITALKHGMESLFRIMEGQQAGEFSQIKLCGLLIIFRSKDYTCVPIFQRVTGFGIFSQFQHARLPGTDARLALEWVSDFQLHAGDL